MVANSIKIIDIQETSGGVCHRVRAHEVDRRVFATQLESEFKLLSTIKELCKAKFVIIENIDMTVNLVIPNEDGSYYTERVKDNDVYYAYYDLAARLCDKPIILSAENFYNVCKDQIEFAAPANNHTKKVEIRKGVPNRNSKDFLYTMIDGTTEDLENGTLRKVADERAQKAIEEQARNTEKEIMKEIKSCSRAENVIHRKDELEMLPEELNGTVTRTIMEIYLDRTISLVFWDNHTIIGIMIDDYTIITLDIRKEQYAKLSEVYGHKQLA